MMKWIDESLFGMYRWVSGDYQIEQNGPMDFTLFHIGEEINFSGSLRGAQMQALRHKDQS